MKSNLRKVYCKYHFRLVPELCLPALQFSIILVLGRLKNECVPIWQLLKVSTTKLKTNRKRQACSWIISVPKKCPQSQKSWHLPETWNIRIRRKPLTSHLILSSVPPIRLFRYQLCYVVTNINSSKILSSFSIHCSIIDFTYLILL